MIKVSDYILNTYGPTETSVCCTYKLFKIEDIDDPITIGNQLK